jgi:hypothetical protein
VSSSSSWVQVGYSEDAAEVSTARTSDSAILPAHWEAAIFARLTPLMGPDDATPSASALGKFELLRYRQHQQFTEHHDGGYRRYSAIIYLSDLPGANDGGETVFTQLNITVKPKAGTDAATFGCPPASFFDCDCARSCTVSNGLGRDMPAVAQQSEGHRAGRQSARRTGRARPPPVPARAHSGAGQVRRRRVRGGCAVEEGVSCTRASARLSDYYD